MQNTAFYLFILLGMLTSDTKAQQKKTAGHFSWSQLAQIPDKYGFAGSFAGVSNNCLIVAGGANFPDGGAPWTGSKKVWTDKIFVLEKPEGQWKEVGKLPKPLGYGVSVSYKNQLICFGGSNSYGHYKGVFGISYKDGKMEITNYPDMPLPLANSSGILAGSTVYIAGGLVKPGDTQAGDNFWSMDLAKSPIEQKWQVLDKLPGLPRMLSSVGASDGHIFLFSGTALHPAADGSAKREYLHDAYEYTVGNGWKKLADLPFATVAPPGPAYNSNKNALLIFGGDNGDLAPKASELKEKHPGFSDHILAYDINNNSWTIQGEIATRKEKDAENNPNGSTWAPVTTSMVIWHNKLVFPGGEVRPATRTPRVLVATVTRYE